MLYFSSAVLQSPSLFQSRFSVGNQMSVVEWANTYGIHHWQIVWSRYRKFAWVEFEPTITEFRLDALTNWTITSWVQLGLRAYFAQLFQFQCHNSFRLFAFVSRHVYFHLRFLVDNHMSVFEWTETYGIFLCQNLQCSYRKLTWVRFEPTTTEFHSVTLSHWTIGSWIVLALRGNFAQLLQFHRMFSVTFYLGCLPSLVATFILIKVFYR